MHSLLATIAGIVLSVVLLTFTLFQGGDLLSKGQVKTEAIKLLNQADQIIAASAAFNAHNGRYPASFSELLDQGYLNSQPLAFLDLILPSAWADATSWQMREGGVPVYTLEKPIDIKVCREVNSRGTLKKDGILHTAYTALSVQCYGPSDQQLIVVASNIGYALSKALPGAKEEPIPDDADPDAWLVHPNEELARGDHIPEYRFESNATDLDFGLVLDDSPLRRTLTLTNTGNVALPLTHATAIHPPFEAWSDTCSGKTLSIGGKCDLVIQFTAPGAGSFSDAFSIEGYRAGAKTFTLAGQWAEAPALSVSKSTVAFGIRSAGSQTRERISITNTGNTQVVINQLQGVVSPFKVDAEDCSAKPLARNASCDVDLLFSPTEAGAFGSTLQLHTDPAVEQQIALSGSVAADPVVALDSVLQFDPAFVGSSSQKTLTVQNVGNTPITMGAVSTISAPFAKKADTCTNTTLAIGTACQVTVEFLPAGAGAANGTVTVNAGSAGVRTVSLQGMALASVARWEPAKVEFGDKLANGSYTLTSTVHNDGNVTGNFDVVLPAGVTATSCSSVPAGGSCAMTFSFTPTAGVAYNSGALKPLGATQAGNTLTVTGTGVAVTTTAAFVESAVDFGSVAKGGLELRTVSLKNTGNSTLSLGVSPATVTGDGFSLGTTNCIGRSLAANESCTVTVVFNPQSIATYSGTLTVDAGAAGSKALGMTGTGTGSIARWSATTVDFGSKVANGSYTLTNTVYNDGNLAGNFNLNLPAGVTATSCASVPAGRSCVMTFTYTPVGGVAYSSGPLSSTGATQSSNTVTVTGSGVEVSATASVSSSSLSFGPIDTGATSTQSVTLTNTGNVPLSLPLAAGRTSGAFSATDTCTSSLAVGSNCSITVTFAPTVVQAYSGTLTINAGVAGVISVGLTGTGKVPDFQANLTINVNTTNYNLRNAAVAAGWDGVLPLKATVTIAAGVQVGSYSSSNYAFQTGTSFPAGSSLTLVNNGSIIGARGAPSSTGGSALLVQAPITIHNVGTIAGGGGGGGVGGQGGMGGQGGIGSITSTPTQYNRSYPIGYVAWYQYNTNNGTWRSHYRAYWNGSEVPLKYPYDMGTFNGTETLDGQLVTNPIDGSQEAAYGLVYYYQIKKTEVVYTVGGAGGAGGAGGQGGYGAGFGYAATAGLAGVTGAAGAAGGTNAGQGGKGGNGGYGGSGGALGASGSTGSPGAWGDSGASGNYGTGGSGYAAGTSGTPGGPGSAVVGNAYVTWSTTGTRVGPIN